ncbi:hypothetical protein EC836_103281 [Erwinia sp. JUb26]|nr:hypothetical protein EC836_103281 [Erwinia sp. JUb26]
MGIRCLLSSHISLRYSFLPLYLFRFDLATKAIRLLNPLRDRERYEQLIRTKYTAKKTLLA